nr:TRAP transporter large permease [uncultured Blautia sp.]
MNIALVSGLIILVLLIVMLIAGVPIAVALGVSSVCAILPVMNLDVAVLTGCQRIFSGISVFSLLAIPFFILAGNIMNKGGIAVRLINLAKLITGRAPGALAQTNILANMLFGSISGSGTAAASAMGSIIGPIEKEEGYDPNFSAAVNIATAPTGLLIPPSNVMITYSLVSGGTSVAALFMAGYIPGALWGLACMLVVYFIAKKKGYRAKNVFTAKEAGKIILQALPCLLLIVIVIGGIIFGVFTATEGSVVAVVYSLCLSLFVYRSITLKEIPQILKESAEMTGIIIFLIGVSSIMSWVMAFTNIPTLVSSALLSVSSNKIVILLLINIILLIVGTFMDMTPACLIFTPIFLPVCTALGMDTIHFGIMMIFNLCIGTITPPVGTTLFVGVKVGNVKIETVFKQLLVYFAAIFVVLMLVTYIPSLCLWLPKMMGYIK